MKLKFKRRPNRRDSDGTVFLMHTVYTLDSDNDGVNDENDAENCDPHNDTDGDGFSNADEIVVVQIPTT